MEPSPDSDVALGDPRRHVWLLIIGVLLLVGVGFTVYRARNVTVLSANELARQEVVRAGADPSSELPYEHFFLLPGKSQATIAAEQLARLDPGFEVGEPAAGEAGTDDEGQWTLTVSHTAALDLKAIDALTRRFEALAEGLGGTYDGWAVDLSNIALSPSV